MGKIMRKILFLLLFVFISFHAFAFDVENLKGADCIKVSDASKDGFDPAFWYEVECSFDDSVTLDSLYNDVLDNIEDAYNEKMIKEGEYYSKTDLDKIKKELSQEIKKLRKTKKNVEYYYGQFILIVTFTKDNIKFSTCDGYGEEAYNYTIQKNNDNTVKLLFSYDSGY